MHLEQWLMIFFTVIAVYVLLFIIDWRYFCDWVVVILFKCLLDILWGSAVVSQKMIEYPVRLFAPYYETCIFFELWIFPVSCVWYNQVTRERGLGGIFFYALLFSMVITAIEYPIEKYTQLIRYIRWDWFTTFYTVTLTFLISRGFIGFYRWGCDYFKHRSC